MNDMRIIPITDVTQSIVKKFFVNRLDVEFIPFTNCNAHCRFCKQKNELIDIDLDVIDNMCDEFVHAIDNYSMNDVEVHLVGGELFQDRFRDDVFQAYQRLIDTVKSTLRARNSNFVIGCTSNLMFDKIDRVIEFVEANELQLSTSYDFAGRFNNHTFSQWKRNVDKVLKTNIQFNTISIIRHKQNLKALLSNSNQYVKHFEKLYNNGVQFEVIDYDNCINDSTYYCDYDQQLQFDKIFVDKYPNALPYRYLIDNFSRDIDHNTLDRCPVETLDINSNAVVFDCCHKTNCMKRVIHAKGCLSCKYQQYCSINCPSAFGFDTYCSKKALFEYIDENINLAKINQ